MLVWYSWKSEWGMLMWSAMNFESNRCNRFLGKSNSQCIFNQVDHNWTTDSVLNFSSRMTGIDAMTLSRRGHLKQRTYRFIKEKNFGVTNKSNCHTQTPLHSSTVACSSHICSLHQLHLRQKLLSTLLGREHQRYMQARSHTKWLSKFLNSHMTSWEM